MVPPTPTAKARMMKSIHFPEPLPGADGGEDGAGEGGGAG
jgi:hypothetical protein